MKKNHFKNLQYYKFCAYGFLKNLKFFEAFFLLFLYQTGLSFTEIGLLYGFREIVIYFMEIPSGLIADALGRKRSMVFSFIFYILSFLIFYISNFKVMLYAAMLFYGIANAFRTGTHKAMIFEYLELKGWRHLKKSYYGGTRASSQLGSALSALVAGFLVFISKEIRFIFLASTLPFVLDIMLIMSYPNELNGNMTAWNSKQFGNRFKEIFSIFMKELRSRENMKIIFHVSSFSGYFKQMKDYLQLIILTLVLSMPVYNGFQQEEQTAVFIGIFFLLSIY